MDHTEKRKGSQNNDRDHGGDQEQERETNMRDILGRRRKWMPGDNGRGMHPTVWIFLPCEQWFLHRMLRYERKRSVASGGETTARWVGFPEL